MLHIVLLLYLLSGFSGISSLIFLIGKYGPGGHLGRGRLELHIIYTSMMLIALVILYLRVNVVKSGLLMPLFIASILTGQGFLLYALSRFSSRMKSTFWKIFPVFYFLLAVFQVILRNSTLALIPITVGVPLFIGITIWFSFTFSKWDKSEKQSDSRLWILFFIFTLIVIAAELLLKEYTGFLGDYTLNIPIIFLAWNFLNLYQFSREQPAEDKIDDSFVISPEIAEKWQLTEREREIAEAVLKGHSNKEIAADLAISSSTVKNHIYNIYRKTGVQSRVELVNRLRQVEFPRTPGH